MHDLHHHQIKTFLLAARALDLEVIPLVQTFGHLEYALKLEQFSHLRENPSVPQAVCPSRNETMKLVEALVDQVDKFGFFVCFSIDI